MDKDQQDKCTTVTHPSVRLRGTENDFTPQTCIDPQCRVAASSDPPFSSPSSPPSPHMHCPFCVQANIYQDAVILIAHYRVKHVDKGIDFAGLRILRCCSRCDIVGAIKGEKKFKGAHWHCYRCKNGFNRRDEAIKHYRTHFRNPLTTFQIHIAQEVNGGTADCSFKPRDQWTPHEESSSIQIAESDEAVVVVQHDDGSEPVVDEPMDDQIEVATSAAFSVHALAVPEEDVELPDTVSWDSSCRLLKLEQQVEHLRLKNKHLEQHYKDEIQQLNMQVDLYSKEIEQMKRREQDLLRCLIGDSCDRSQELIASLQAQHTRLLQHQLLQVRQWALTQVQHENGLPVTTTTTATTDTLPLAFPSDVFTLILDGRGALMTPTKLLVHSDKEGVDQAEENESGSNSSALAGSAEVVVTVDESLADETEFVHCDSVLSTT